VTLTKEAILQELDSLIEDLLVWELEGPESMIKALYYIDGAHDLCKGLIKRLETKGV
jgi:hypothetical protein